MNVILAPFGPSYGQKKSFGAHSLKGKYVTLLLPKYLAATGKMLGSGNDDCATSNIDIKNDTETSIRKMVRRI